MINQKTENELLNEFKTVVTEISTLVINEVTQSIILKQLLSTTEQIDRIKKDNADITNKNYILNGRLTDSIKNLDNNITKLAHIEDDLYSKIVQIVNVNVTEKYENINSNIEKISIEQQRIKNNIKSIITLINQLQEKIDILSKK